MDKKFKQYAASVTQVSDRKMSFTITTASVDRDNDTIDPKGWDTKNFMANPVVLWAHDYSQPPVGKAVNVEMTKEGLKADVEFLPIGMNPFADMIHDMCKGGFLNATSVGFRGTEYTKSKDRDHGYDFSKQELLEFSIVPVPSNPEALIQRGTKNELVQRYAKAMRLWTKAQLGDDAPKLDAEQFDNLADAIAKAMKEPDAKKEAQDIDITALAQAVVNNIKDTKALEPDYKKIAEHVIDAMPSILRTRGPHISESAISQEVIDIQAADETPFDINSIKFPEKKAEFHFTPEQVAEALMRGFGHSFREVVGAQARAAINHMTGRLD